MTSIISYAVGAAGYFSTTESVHYELADALPPSGLVNHENCVEPSDLERALVKLAVDTLAFPEEGGFLVIGAQKFLSHNLYRGEGRTSKRVCDVEEEYKRAALAFRNFKYFQRGRIVEYELKLIAKLSDPDEDLAQVVAGSAFNGSIQQSEYLPNRDIRPFARAILATLGPFARPYAQTAFDQITIQDSMGTGAAQVAIAGEHPMALEIVEELMTETLKTLPENKAVLWDTRNRLYEMAYALSLGGDQAKQHIAPLRNLMSRKVQSWSPPFGMTELPPRRMCSLLAKILNEQLAALEYSYCRNLDEPYEQ